MPRTRVRNSPPPKLVARLRRTHHREPPPSLAHRSCAFNQLDCQAEKANVEKIITAAGGTLTPCGNNYGLDSSICNTLGGFIYNDKIPDPNGDLSSIAKSVSICSPLIPALFKLPKFMQYAQFASYFGPCSLSCAYGACGLNIICPDAAQGPLDFIANYTAQYGCPGSNGTNTCDSLMLPVTGRSMRSHGSGTAGPATYGSNLNQPTATAAAGTCEALTNGTCQSCQAIANDCLWCANKRRCVSGGGWFGAGDALKNATNNLFNFDQDCGDWQYGQCAMQGRVLVYVGFGGIGLLVLIIVGVAICCCCMCRARRQKSKSYSLLLNNDEKDADDVALLQSQEARE